MRTSSQSSSNTKHSLIVSVDSDIKLPKVTEESVN